MDLPPVVRRGRRADMTSLVRSGAFAAVSALLVLGGCADTTLRSPGPESAPVLQGPAVSGNGTPLDTAFTCFGGRIMERGTAPIAVGVGEVRDFTGKSSINEGATITQGGALMVMSALGKLGRGVRIHERFDPRVGELELIYSDRRQLGDGRVYAVPDGRQMRPVPWLPYMGGSILRSQFFIVGGITEVNWAVQSGGLGVRVNGVGLGARTFTMNIAADLRIVDTRSLVVLHTVSLQKQVVGHEVNGDIFRFFGSRLFDISAGTRNLEPVQMAVRAVLELGVLELMSSVSGVAMEGCLDEAVAAGLVSRAYTPPAAPSPPPVQPAAPPPAAEPTPREQRRQRRAPAASSMAPEATVPVAPGTSAARTAPVAGSNDARMRRPDSETRPPIPTWLEGPQLPPSGSGTLMRPNGATPPAIVPLPSSSVPSSEPPPHLQDGNRPGTGVAINILG